MTAWKILLRFEGEPNTYRVATLSRKVRELAERELSDLNTRYGFVVDIIEPRRVVNGN